MRFEIRKPQNDKIVAAAQNKKTVCCQSPAKRRHCSRFATVNAWSLKLQAVARRIHDSNAAHITIASAKSTIAVNNADDAECADSTAKNTAPIAATPAAFAICAVVPYR